MSRLNVKELAVKVHLGCTPEERKVAQEVRFSIELQFTQNPTACLTDKLEDTHCYVKICDALRATCLEKEFQTIEHLSEVALNNLKPSLSKNVRGLLHLHKVKPPIDGLLGGVIFSREF